MFTPLTSLAPHFRTFSITALVLGLSFSSLSSAQETDYSNGDNWLCRADASDLGACDVELSTTIVNSDGRLARETFIAATNSPIDCFYVYPTVSLDATPNSDLVAGPEEYNVVTQQFARFASRCRTFAPMYRQFTLTALRGGGIAGADREMGYRDVLAAWNYYLENFNEGRGVVLVGHSQGSGVLTSLIRNEIDGKDIQQQIISAMLLGTTVQVPEGKDVGGTFEHMPICTSGSQTQCIIVYATFRDTAPPSAGGMFGRNGSNTVSACTNPAQLAKGSNEAHAYLNAAPGRTGVDSWTKQQPLLDTPFASAPGLISTECVGTETHRYLQLSVNSDSDDARADDIGGDILTAEGTPDTAWGLHLIDANVGMGDLLTLLSQQAVSYLGKQ